jgi:hypothetical protein
MTAHRDPASQIKALAESPPDLTQLKFPCGNLMLTLISVW